MTTTELKNIIRTLIKTEMREVIRDEVQLSIKDAFGKLASGQSATATARPTNVIVQNPTNEPPPVSRPQINENAKPVITTRFAALNEALRQTTGGLPIDGSATKSVLDMASPTEATVPGTAPVVPTVLTELATGGRNFASLLKQADAIAKKQRTR